MPVVRAPVLLHLRGVVDGNAVSRVIGVIFCSFAGGAGQKPVPFRMVGFSVWYLMFTK
jgi:hypothetical protein